MLSKQKLVTNEDIAAFCRWRLALADADIQIKKGFIVLPGHEQGLVRTLEVYIALPQKDMSTLKEKATILFWQQDMETAIIQHSSFFIPVRVFIILQKNIIKRT